MEFGSKKLSVAVITLNYNQNQYTADCIRSILDSDHQELNIILIDNEAEQGNSHKLKKLLPDDKRISVHSLYPNRGYVGGINYAFSILDNGLDYDYILILNNDTILDPHAISALVKTCRDYDNKAIVTGKVYDYEEKNLLQDVGSVIENPDLMIFRHLGLNKNDTGDFNNIAERDMIDDVFWLMSKSIFKKIGIYDPVFFFNGESADYAIRAKKAGYKLIYTPEAKLWHKGTASAGGRKDNPFLSYWQMRSTLTFRYKHLDRENFRKFVFIKIQHILAGYLRCLKDIFKGNLNSFRSANARLKGMIDFFVKVKPKMVRSQSL